MQEIESGAAAEIVDSSSEALLEELRRKRRKLALRPFAICGAVLLQLIGLRTESGWAILFFVVFGLALILAAGYRDRIARTAVILYELEPQVEEAFRRFTEWAQALAGAGRMWHVAGSVGVMNRKYHAGASGLVQRNGAVVRTSSSRFAPPPA